ncbi:MAG: (p)ppGpp synthetase [Chloroflexi bacterium]|nr:MAG: (p)ppGpp synthetase [Chloroflexota bacterium]PIE80945.1 MAG: (p)ppGpp synthetase [Chloroflexota bacterium]
MTQTALITLAEFLENLPEGPKSNKAEQIKKAHQFSYEAHGNCIRESGESYIGHDLGVAQILLGLGVDTATLVAGILHDTLCPHTNKTEEKLLQNFGEEVSSLVIGLNNLYAYTEGRACHQHRQNETLETIRRAILSIIEGDIRIILIRMADCLQDLRKAHNLDADKQFEIAYEAMKIYAPLANRLGVWQLKWELEDLAFRYLQPESYKDIAGKLDERRAGRAARIEKAKEKLQAKIKELNIKCTVTGRPKHIYSIYRKMERKQLDFEQIFDVHALRVIIEPTDPKAYAQKSSKEKEDEDRFLCYQVLGAVHSIWQPIPKEFDDYIASPKPNGYKSLHTAVINQDSGYTLEVQIRTKRMHEEAERGIAAHWAYKENGAKVTASAQRRIQNLREVLAAMRESGEVENNDEVFEAEVMAERIYVFTPRGDVIDLPKGATPIDFAYQVHTQVGHRCRGARIDGKMVSLDYKLQSGQRVEILTSKRGGPSRDWMNASLGYSGSARTRSKIRTWFRTQEREQNIAQGREVVERELKRLGLSEVYTIQEIAKALRYDDEDEFLAKIGFGDIQSTQISGAIAILKQNLKEDDELRPLLQTRRKPKGLTVRGLSGLHTKMAGCCNPVPPEPIVGYITRGQGVTIHSQECKQVKAITETERLIDVDWGAEEEAFPIPIVVKAYRRPGLVDEMTSILRGRQITATKTKTMTDGSIRTVYLEVEVSSLAELNWLLQKFENMPNVIEANRQRWT